MNKSITEMFKCLANGQVSFDVVGRQSNITGKVEMLRHIENCKLNKNNIVRVIGEIEKE